MKKTVLLAKIQEFVQKWNTDPDNEIAYEALIDIEKLIEGYLQNHPRDTDMWLKLAVVEDTVPLADYVKAMSCLERVLEYDPHNIEVLLILATIHHLYREIPDELFVRLIDVKIDDASFASLLSYAKAWYYKTRRNERAYEQMLVQSIELYPKFVNNYIELADLYEERGDAGKACQYLKKAISNVVHVFKESELYDFTDVNNFINEHIKGTFLSGVNYYTLYQRTLRCQE